MKKLESNFQTEFFKKVKVLFPNCIILKNDSRYLQGIPDWILLYNDKYAMLEMKRSEHERHQPNQDYYVDLFSKMSYSSFVYPENEAAVLMELLNYFN